MSRQQAMYRAFNMKTKHRYYYYLFQSVDI